MALLSISPFISGNIFFMYLGGSNWGYIYLQVLNLLIDPFIIMQCPSLSLVTFFVLKSILHDISIAPVVLFHFSLHGISFPTPSLSSCVCF